jgi:hypothetical protein
MGHGAWMGIAWGNMEDGCMGLKHNSRDVTCFDGDMFWRLTHASKRALSCSLKCDMFSWVVDFEVQVSRFMFCGGWFSTGQNE